MPGITFNGFWNIDLGVLFSCVAFLSASLSLIASSGTQQKVLNSLATEEMHKILRYLQDLDTCYTGKQWDDALKCLYETTKSISYVAATSTHIKKEHKTELTTINVQLRGMKKLIEEAKADSTIKLFPAEMNGILSGQVDRLQKILAKCKKKL